MIKQEVLDSLKNFSGEFPRAALMEVQSNREEFIPELLESLDYAQQNAGRLYEEKSVYFFSTYAMYLLAEFREKKAFPRLVALLQLPEEYLDFLVGDTLTEGFSRFLLCTYDEENLHLLLDVIEDQDCYEWARVMAIEAYGLLYMNGFVVQEGFVSYLRDLIYNKLPSDDCQVFTAIAGCIIDCRLYQMIPDARFLYEDDRVDEMMNGKYDSFLDFMFNEYKLEKTYIDDTIAEMEWWACFKKESMEELPKKDFKELFQKFREAEKAQSQISEQKKQKTGRNDPCPCGSGKKYKKCCYLLPQAQQNSGVAKVEDIYNLLGEYPTSSLFKEMYEEEAINIDMLVYKALNHRAIPIWVKRDYEEERFGKIKYLKEALDLFLAKCKREQIANFAAYDERYMVHYRSSQWVKALCELINEYDYGDIAEIERIAENTLQVFAAEQ